MPRSGHAMHLPPASRWDIRSPDRLLRSRMLLRKRDASLVGSDLHESSCRLDHRDAAGKPLEPTQLFESAVELANFFFLMWLLKRRKFDGQVFGAFMFIYGIARFLLEYLRDDPGRVQYLEGR